MERHRPAKPIIVGFDPHLVLQISHATQIQVRPTVSLSHCYYWRRIHRLDSCRPTVGWDPSLSVTLIESASVAGRGVAYATSCSWHLLNVPAANMSAFPEDPEHFVRWAQLDNDSGTGLKPGGTK